MSRGHFTTGDASSLTRKSHRIRLDQSREPIFRPGTALASLGLKLVNFVPSSTRVFALSTIGWLGMSAGFSQACTVTALAERESSIAVNTCDSTDECSGGRCRGGICVAPGTELSTLLFELTPATNAGAIAGSSFLAVAPNVGEGVIELELSQARVVGSLTPERGGCALGFRGIQPGQTLAVGADGTIPTRVTFTPSIRSRLPAFAGQVIGAETVESANSVVPAMPISHQFAADLPSGTYDLHAEPFELSTEAPRESSCRFPPQLIRGLCIEAEAGGRTELKLALPVPAQLELVVTAQEQQLSGWVADVIDSTTGRRISLPVPLSLPSTDQGVSAYRINLDYQPVVEHLNCRQQPRGSASEIVRLSPPGDKVAPVLLFDREALELFSRGRALIDGVPVLPSPVTVEGHVFSRPGGSPEAATLTLVARKLSGLPAGVLAALTRRVQSRSDGQFEVQVLPGSYEVHIEPQGPRAADEPPLAATRVSWEIAEHPPRQGGRAVELGKALTVLGSAVLPGPGRVGARGASVIADASAKPPVDDVLVRALSGVFLVPRATTAVISDPNGSFGIHSDFGIFDFSIRPPEGSGLAWLVMANLDLSAPEETRQLSRLALPLPVVVPIAAWDPSSKTPIEGARVRAFAAVDELGGPTLPGSESSFVLVAEGRLDAAGRVGLMVPASLHRALPE